ncbi:hypothetical protein [Candidatus Ruminimicrobium bovinum]|uniref:hypothetical protein n=1 Tax=Candidatus Ruminimicrobium bovinum TaxID=3242779 RepID=UPI0039B8A0D4
MKKKLIWGIVFILIGIFCSRYISNINAKSIFNSGELYYFVQEGVYTNKKIMNNDLKDIKNRAVISKNNKYYVYVGISKDLEIAKLIKKIYEDKGYQIYIKELSVDDKEFSSNVEQFDLLIKNSSNDEDILTIESVVLSNYEEIINNK